MTTFQLLAGGLTGAAPTDRSEPAERVLHPRAALSSRAGITPIRVPADLWLAPELVTAMRPPRLLRAVA